MLSEPEWLAVEDARANRAAAAIAGRLTRALEELGALDREASEVSRRARIASDLVHEAKQADAAVSAFHAQLAIAVAGLGQPLTAAAHNIEEDGGASGNHRSVDQRFSNTVMLSSALVLSLSIAALMLAHPYSHPIVIELIAATAVPLLVVFFVYFARRS